MKLRTNIHQVIDPIVQKLQSPVPYDKVLRIVATSMLGEIKVRIHQKGIASDGSDIGKYSTKPAYFPPVSGLPKFDAQGKTGKKVFASGEKKGQAHKTRYFETGYSGLRGATGRQVSKVDLSLTGQLDKQFTIIPTEKGYGLGWPDAEKLIRAKGLEKHYGKEIWNLTADEREKAILIANEEINNAI